MKAKQNLLYRVVVRDKDGKAVYDSGLRKSKSYVIQWLEMIEIGFRGTGTKYITDITNTERSVGFGVVKDINAGVGVTNRGIRVGTGTTPATNSDYALESAIAEGTGAGQLSHQAQSIAVVVIVAGNVDLVLTRSFINNSGATITVNEIGLYMYGGVSYPWTFLLVRDVLPAGVAVLAGQTLTVQYTMRTTV